MCWVSQFHSASTQWDFKWCYLISVGCAARTERPKYRTFCGLKPAEILSRWISPRGPTCPGPALKKALTRQEPTHQKPKVTRDVLFGSYWPIPVLHHGNNKTQQQRELPVSMRPNVFRSILMTPSQLGVIILLIFQPLALCRPAVCGITIRTLYNPL